ncbi:hypothetical protein JG688_00008207 [Phytophthora aleatoria]|uniref:Uncharacterized protein n=1 Tax=Phytophthora aleatoria TaxID=2496075 RepID=A0A8J5M7J5_9STRA|nr:hypothetical protein JG688_00008207 [Phytophthora aleatoria]
MDQNLYLAIFMQNPTRDESQELFHAAQSHSGQNEKKKKHLEVLKVMSNLSTFRRGKFLNQRCMHVSLWMCTTVRSKHAKFSTVQQLHYFK